MIYDLFLAREYSLLKSPGLHSLSKLQVWVLFRFHTLCIWCSMSETAGILVFVIAPDGSLCGIGRKKLCKCLEAEDDRLISVLIKSTVEVGEGPTFHFPMKRVNVPII